MSGEAVRVAVHRLRKRYRHVIETVERQRMIHSLDVKDHVVAGEIDLRHDPPGCHLFEQIVGMFFLHDIDAMADAFRICYFHRGPDMKP